MVADAFCSEHAHLEETHAVELPPIKTYTEDNDETAYDDNSALGYNASAQSMLADLQMLVELSDTYGHTAGNNAIMYGDGFAPNFDPEAQSILDGVVMYDASPLNQSNLTQPIMDGSGMMGTDAMVYFEPIDQGTQAMMLNSNGRNYSTDLVDEGIEEASPHEHWTSEDQAAVKAEFDAICAGFRIESENRTFDPSETSEIPLMN
ncbi:hypothetical protein F5Y14DRAFT_463891 [Nemania sp. NC0429]|nr:hypothetical protein F5Y14DRAFT_463891 [Nemania sp. NC0429]